jgi:hypothetical protein
MAESYVQVAPDGTGKLIDTQTITEPDGTVTHRQVVVIGDSVNDIAARVSPSGLIVDEAASADGEFQEELLKQILIELRLLNYLIASEFRVREDLDALRNDPALRTT